MDPPGSISGSSRSTNSNETRNVGYGNDNANIRADSISITERVANIVVDEEEQEQFRLMAMIEANVRVMDNTGFDRAEYDRQQQQQQQQQQQRDDSHQSNNNPRVRPRPMHFFFSPPPIPRPTLPVPPRSQYNRPSLNSPFTSTMTGSMSASSFSASSHTDTAGATTTSFITTFPAFAQEASLPPRRANRWYNKHPRSTIVPELCDGVVVQLPDGSIVDETIIEERGKEDYRSDIGNDDLPARPTKISHDPCHIIVDCLGCGCRLRVHRLAGLVNCSRCLTVSPSIPPEDGR
ncbi:hypothetical protein IV203_001014 [Nitzschia inconspicua]|uniref:Uncharacterized protein n=1 Tax=Nitzschia inconspicua TaxID=303405 RepID=A0A9K3L7R9_9STRA|nr:hypothetical protein IV203_001014 [Nitzschia inconspicua]